LKKEQLELKAAFYKLKKSIIIVGIFSFFINLIMLVPPLYMLQLYDRVLTSRSQETLLMLTLIVVVLFITMGLLEITRSKVLVRLGNKLDLFLSTRVFDSVFALSNKYPAKSTSKPISDLTQIRQFMSGNGLFAFFDAPWLPVYIFVLFWFHPMFGYFAIFTAIVLFSIALLNEKNTKEPLEKANGENVEAMRFVDSNLRNSEVVHAMGMLPNIKKAWQQKYYKFLNSQTYASEKAAIWSNSAKTLRLMFQSLMLGLGAYLAVKMEVTPGMMIAGSIILGRALAPLDLAINTWKGFSNARTSYARLTELLQEFPPKKEAMQLPKPKGRIVLENIVVIPPAAQAPSIIGVSMNIDAGEIVGVIGPSAAGKSSLVRALLGLWPLRNGVVRIDGADISQWAREDLGKFIGYLPQDIELFEGTISQNIARFNEVDPKKVLKAAQLAGVHDLILKMPEGYDTYITANSLSGGQKQRVALARSIYDDPVLVVLDEPNSNLDDVGEKALMNCINHLKQAGTTVIIVTHKKNILAATTKLTMMRDGKLQAYGETTAVMQQLTQAVQQTNTPPPSGGVYLCKPGEK